MTDETDRPVALVTGGAIHVGAAIVREIATAAFRTDLRDGDDAPWRHNSIIEIAAQEIGRQRC